MGIELHRLHSRQCSEFTSVFGRTADIAGLAVDLECDPKRPEKPSVRECRGAVYGAFTTLQAKAAFSFCGNGARPQFATMNCGSIDIENAAASLRQEATSLAGGLGDLAQRASVYHHLFEHSGGNHCFPLLAAHGALWASGYFRSGMRVGSIVSWGHAAAGNERHRQELMRRLTKFANDFRDINRRVCVETYFVYHLSNADHLFPAAERLILLRSFGSNGAVPRSPQGWANIVQW